MTEPEKCHVCNGSGHWLTRKDIECSACNGSGLAKLVGAR
jgi:DnaJ-class molecular chaperone